MLNLGLGWENAEPESGGKMLKMGLGWEDAEAGAGGRC